jgi:hypothetical protein
MSHVRKESENWTWTALFQYTVSLLWFVSVFSCYNSMSRPKSGTQFSCIKFMPSCGCSLFSAMCGRDRFLYASTYVLCSKYTQEWIINWEGCGRKWSCPNLRLEGLRKITKKFSQDNQSMGQDLNPRPPEYVAGVLATWSNIIVVTCCLWDKKSDVHPLLFSYFIL